MTADETEATPTAAGDRLTLLLHAQAPDGFSAIAPRMQEFVDKGEAAGIVTLIATKDRILHLNAVGKSDLASDVPEKKDRKLQTDDIFWIASMSKPITVACLAILADDGKLTFDDPLAKHLPAFANLMVSQNGQTAAPERPVTLRDVATHTSGFGEMATRDPHLTLAETSKKLAQLPLRFQPGTRWSYSTAGIDILGRVVEVVGGMPFDQFLQKRILDPLGMKDTSFSIAPERASRWAHSYRWNAQSGKLDETTIPYLLQHPRDRPRAPSARRRRTLLHRRRHRPLLPDDAKQGHPERQANPEGRDRSGDDAQPDRLSRGPPGMPWGLGFCVVEDPSKMAANSALSPNSFGHGGAYSTQSWADPTRNLIWIVMFERDGKGNPDNSDVRIAF